MAPAKSKDASKTTAKNASKSTTRNSTKASSRNTTAASSMDGTVNGTRNTTTKRKRAESESAALVRPTAEGTVYMFGMGDIGQLGIDAEKRKYPALVPELPNGGKHAVQVQCGSTHTVVLTKDGDVYTYGNNDDGALGRETAEEDDMKVPGKVELPEKVVQVTAGDSHTAALTETGVVYVWGSFRNANGLMGLVPENPKPVPRPVPLQLFNSVDDPAETSVVAIASGSNHLVMRTIDGHIYTCGSGDQGQLGRQKPRTSTRRTMNPVTDNDYLLKPMLVRSLGSKKVAQIWTGDYSTYCKVRSGPIWVFGLNNYGQLGIKPIQDETAEPVIHAPIKSSGLLSKNWVQIAASEHHMLALDADGIVHAAGRNEDGRLGLGSTVKERSVWEATPVPKLSEIPCSLIACGLSTSYAVSKDKQQLYAWGFGENFQLAKGDDTDEEEPVMCKFSAKDDTLENVVQLTAGAQHVGLIRLVTEAKETNNNVVVAAPEEVKTKAAVKRPAPATASKAKKAKQ